MRNKTPLALSLPWILFAFVNTLLAAPRAPLQATPTPGLSCDSSTATEVEKALCLINNWFVSNGTYQGTLVSQQNLWSMDFQNLGTALSVYPGSFLTAGYFYPEGTTALLKLAQDGPFNYFRLYLDNPHFEGRLESSWNLRSADCSRYLPVDSSTPDRAQVIAFNAFLKYACTVLDAYQSVTDPKTELDYDFITNQSGAPSAIEAYLNGYISQGLLGSFELDIPGNNLTLHLPPNAPGIKLISVWLTAERISSYSIEQERIIKESNINSLQKFQIIFFPFTASDTALSIPKSRLFNAIEAVRKLGQGTAPDKRRSFMLSYYGFDPASPFPTPTPSPQEGATAGMKEPLFSPAASSRNTCAYHSGVVTPCNQTAVHLIGWDHNHFMRDGADIETLHSALENAGYNVTTIDFNLISKKDPAAPLVLPQLPLLKQAQSILVEARRMAARMDLSKGPVFRRYAMALPSAVKRSKV